ncbi:hypothetical protein C7410_15327 [Paraburkholderia silvatlantica]|uniref:Uncharacterized protein n=2 Tax=Paraburkholderia silvatlantica TaxID=321895 RepID=A0A2V4SX39_9BURK|nr:hypothetical protein C7410_15327 [Paraburkholderia silvatlantica]
MRFSSQNIWIPKYVRRDPRTHSKRCASAARSRSCRQRGGDRHQREDPVQRGQYHAATRIAWRAGSYHRGAARGPDGNILEVPNLSPSSLEMHGTPGYYGPCLLSPRRQRAHPVAAIGRVGGPLWIGSMSSLMQGTVVRQLEAGTVSIPPYCQDRRQHAPMTAMADDLSVPNCLYSPIPSLRPATPREMPTWQDNQIAFRK